MKTPVLKTKRLILRPIVLEDAPSYEKNFVDYEVIRNLHRKVPWPYPKNGIVEFIEGHILPNQGKDRWMWGILLNENPNEIIGGVELWRDGNPENRGFWLGRHFWGQSIMTEAVEIVMEYAFNELGFEKLTFSNAFGNVGSRKIKEKTGARLLRVEPGEFVDPTFTEREIWELSKVEWDRFKRANKF